MTGGLVGLLVVALLLVKVAVLLMHVAPDSPNATKPPATRRTYDPSVEPTRQRETSVPTAPSDYLGVHGILDRLQLPLTQCPAPGSPWNVDTAKAYLQSSIDCVSAGYAAAFANAGVPYRPVPLVVFSGTVTTGCGATDYYGFYCSATGDQRIYLNASHLPSLVKQGEYGKMRAFHLAAHEVTHHAQAMSNATAAARASEESTTQSSRRIELQALCIDTQWLRLTPGASVLYPLLDERNYKPDAEHGTMESYVLWVGRGRQSAVTRDCNALVAPLSEVR